MVEVNFFFAVLSTALLALVTIAIIKPQETYKYFQRKRYQYNVTLALYMLTPTERFIFSTYMLPGFLPAPAPGQRRYTWLTFPG